MMRPNDEQLESSQKTVWFYPEAVAADVLASPPEPRFSESLQAHMLIENTYTQILPIGGRLKDSSFQIHLVPPSPSVGSLISSALHSRGRDRPGDLPGAVSDFFIECTQTMMEFGEAIYEIVYFRAPGSQKLVRFGLEYVRPQTMKRRWGKLVQVVPRIVVEKRGGPAFISLPQDTLLVFTFPSRTRSVIRPTLQALQTLSKKLVPEFALAKPAELDRSINYDMSDQLYYQRLALAQAGRAIGWNARGLFENDVLQYYSLMRYLTFERFKIEIRNSILTTLNDGLATVGGQMGFEGRIEIDGLPTLDELAKAESELAAGRKSFHEILKPFQI